MMKRKEKLKERRMGDLGESGNVENYQSMRKVA
jgi:hypothetical protein